MHGVIQGEKAAGFMQDKVTKVDAWDFWLFILALFRKVREGDFFQMKISAGR